MPPPHGPLIPSDTPPPPAAPEGAVRVQHPSAPAADLLRRLHRRFSHARANGLCPFAAARVAAGPAPASASAPAPAPAARPRPRTHPVHERQATPPPQQQHDHHHQHSHDLDAPQPPHTFANRPCACRYVPVDAAARLEARVLFPGRGVRRRPDADTPRRKGHDDKHKHDDDDDDDDDEDDDIDNEQQGKREEEGADDGARVRRSLRMHLAEMDEDDKLRACRDRFMASYKRSKTVKLAESVRALFVRQYLVERRDTDGLLGCKHYARGCKMKAKCCGLVVACRFCHDEEMGDDHEMDRFATEKVVCMACFTEQPVAESCVQCGQRFAHWFCKYCRFYENTPGKKVYHCHRCNICRLGEGLGIDNFHCDKCDACVSLESQTRHRCLSKALHANCPVCTGYLFTSTEPVFFMRCGHTMHSDCFRQYTARRYQCPLCMHSIVDMKTTFENIDRSVRDEPMPPEFHHKRSRILCNDCGNKCVAPYHFLHHKCDNTACNSYNTHVLEEFELPQDEAGSRQAATREAGETEDRVEGQVLEAVGREPQTRDAVTDDARPPALPCSVGAPSNTSTPDTW